MTAPTARQRTAGRLGVAAGTLGVIAGVIQTTAGASIPNWTGNKDNPVGLGLLTILLSLVAVGVALTLRTPVMVSAGHRAAVAIGLLIPGTVCFSTVGRLWYLPGLLLLLAFGLTLTAGGAREVLDVVGANWTRGLISVLGAIEILMAVSARPVTTIVVGVAGGIALMVAPWLSGRVRTAYVPLLLIGTLPFAAVTWWSLATPLLAAVTLIIGLTVAFRTGTVRRMLPSRN